MTFKTSILRQEIENEKTSAWSEGIGILRAVVIGGFVFATLSVPLMLNVQTKKYVSQTVSMKLKLRVIHEKLVDIRNSVNAELEALFPNAQVVEVDGKRFYIRSK